MSLGVLPFVLDRCCIVDLVCASTVSGSPDAGGVQIIRLTILGNRLTLLNSTSAAWKYVVLKEIGIGSVTITRKDDK